MFGQETDRDIDEDTLLEDEDLFEGPITPNEVPDLRGDVKIIASIESELSGIEYLLQDIKTIGGVNREIALEAANYSEAIKNTNINFFTKEPTRTNLTFTQESLIDSIRANFRKIYEKIREWIRQLIAWFVGIYKKIISDKDYEKAKQEVSIKEENADKAWQTIVDHLDKANAEIRDLEKQPEFLSHIVKNGEIPSVYNVTVNLLYENPNFPINRILKGDDPFVHDIILMGPYIRLIMELVERLPSINLQLVAKLEKINEVYRNETEGNHSGIERNISLRTLKEVEEPVFYVVDGKRFDSQDMVTEINRIRERIRNYRGDTSIQFPELVLRLFTNTQELKIDRMSRMHSKAVADMIGLEESVATLSSLEQRIEYGDYNSKGNNEIVSAFRTAIAKVSYEINYVTIVLRYIKNTLDQIFYMCRETVHFSDNLLEWLINKSKKERVEVPKPVYDAMVRMKSRRNHNYAVYRKYTMNRPE